MNLTEKNIREKEFHNKLQSKKSGRFENIFYKALYNLYEDFNSYIFEKAKNQKENEPQFFLTKQKNKTTNNETLE